MRRLVDHAGALLADAPRAAAASLTGPRSTSSWTRAQGAHLWDADGNRWLDAAAGAAFLGRNHPALNQALADVLSMDLPNLCVVNASALGGLLAGQLIERAGGGFGKVSFANSGSETTEVALRFCRQITRRRRFLYLKGAIHGRSTGAISVCDWPQLRAHFDPAMPVCTAVPLNDTARLRKELRAGDVAGLIVEPVQAMTGHAPDAGWLREAELLCEQHGTVLVVSEVMTGLGRTGHWFHSMAHGVRPGILTVGGALCGGQMPVGAVLVSEPIYERIYAGFSSGLVYFSTFAENNLAMAAGLATLETLAALDAPAVAGVRGEQLRAGLTSLTERHGGTVHGAGLLVALHGTDPDGATAERLAAHLTAAHIVLPPRPPGTDITRFQLPVVASEDDVGFLLDAVEHALSGTPARVAPPREAPSLHGDVRALPPVGADNDDRGPVLLDADVLVVGSGPGGLACATALAESGIRVTLVEAGNATPARWEGGLRNTVSGLPAPSIRALGGGGTAPALWRRPDPVALRRWATEQGASTFDAVSLDAHARAIETWWDGVPPTPPTDPRGQRFMEAAAALGFGAEPVRLAPAWVPERADPIRAAGGTVVGDVEVTGIRLDLGRAAGVVGKRSDGSHVRITAQVTVLAAGAVGTAALLSGVAQPTPLRHHLEGWLVGLLAEPVGPWTGPVDGARTAALRDHGVDVDLLAPDLDDLVLRLPADVRAQRRVLARLDRLVALRVRGDAEGSTGASSRRGDVTTLDWTPSQADVDRMRLGLIEAARLLGAMGAETIYPGASGLPEDIGPDELADQLRQGRFTAADLGLRAIHPHGTAAIGRTTRADGAVVGIDDLYVADASLLPGSPGADPQVTVMALGHAVGTGLSLRNGGRDLRKLGG